jgi:glycosyltransferase involved in cell wall biosynthesis
MTNTKEVTRVAVVCRVVPQWRITVFERLAADPTLELQVIYGTNSPTAKHKTPGGLTGDLWRELPSFALRARMPDTKVTMPLSPSLPQALRDFEPDVMILEGASNAANNLLALAYGRLTNTPHAWWSLGDIDGKTRHHVVRMLRRLADTGEQSASAIVSYSTSGRDYFLSRGIPPRKIVVAPNSVDDELEDQLRLEQVDEARRVRTEVASSETVILLFVGALTAPKRVERLIDAATVLIDRGADVHLLIVGDGPEREALQAQAAGATHVTFAGRRVEDAATYFGAGDVFVLPGLGGLAISQALVHSLPVICGVADGTERDLVRDGHNGKILTDVTPNALADAIAPLVASQELRRRYGRESRRIIDEESNIRLFVAGLRRAVTIAAADAS